MDTTGVQAEFLQSFVMTATPRPKKKHLRGEIGQIKKGCVAKNGRRSRMTFHTHRVLDKSIPFWSVIGLSHPVFCSILNHSSGSRTGVNIHVLGYSIEMEIQRWCPSSSFFPSVTRRKPWEKTNVASNLGPNWAALPLVLAHHTHLLFGHKPLSFQGVLLQWRKSCTHATFFALFLKRKTVMFGWWWATMHASKY